jgi:hypothetical protein
MAKQYTHVRVTTDSHAGRFVAHGPRSLLSGRRALHFSLSESATVVRNKSAPALALGAVSAGERNGEGKRQQAATPSPSAGTIPCGDPSGSQPSEN